MIKYFISFSFRSLFLFTIFSFFNAKSLAQCSSCAATTFNVDLSGAIDTTYTIQSVRNGDCCSGSNCIRFNITLNPASSFVNFSVANPAPNGAAYYQINCGPQTSLGTPACISGLVNVCISYCKPGNDNPTYTITARSTIQGSDDITIRENCSGNMSVIGLQPGTISWTSIFPGAPGVYNSFLSCVSGCASTTVTPQAGAPPYIDYKVSGNKICSGLATDTVRIYTVPELGLAISPFNPTICGPGSAATLTATPTGGAAPFSYLWSNGQTTKSITVGSTGNYTVTISDNTNCASISQNITVSAGILPTTPIASNNGPLCEGATLNLTANAVPGAGYNWTGPNGFTSSSQNPVINNVTPATAGNYIVTASLNGCINTAGATTTVTVNSYPARPTVSSNSPVCAGATLTLNTPTIAGAVYKWSGPNGFTSAMQNPVINNTTLADTGVYYLTLSVNGCTSEPGSTIVVVNPLPAVPLVSNNGPVCTGVTLNLTANTMGGAAYTWTGPNGFTSAVQNPVINNTTLAHAGNYNVTASINGCTGKAGITTVLINPAPASPSASNNGPLCIGQALQLYTGTIPNALYTWAGPNGFTSNVQNPLVNNTTLADTGIYYAMVTVNNCASAPAATTVVIKPIPLTPVITSNSPLCAGDTLLLNTPLIAGVSYNWTGPDGFNSSQQSAVLSNVSSSNEGVYQLTVKGCTTASNTTSVVLKPTPSTPIAGNKGPVCVGQTMYLIADNIPGASYSWTGPNGFTSNLQNPAITNSALSNTGIYNLIAAVNGCFSSPGSTTVAIHPRPFVDAGTNRVVPEGETIILQPSVNSNNLQYLWTPGLYLDNATIQNPVVTGVNDQIYILKVTDASGCSNEDNVFVKVLRSIKVPNTFTPNNDGINDEWIIQNLEDYPDCRVQVFNRYGILVFESKGYVKPWNGTYNGRSLPFGTYYYIIDPGGRKQVAGYVTIIK